MGEYLTSEELGKSSGLPEDDVDVPGRGKVRVRGLSRAEAMRIQGLSGTAAIERAMLAVAMVRPRMTEGAVREWQESSVAGEIEPVTDKVSELSGMKAGAEKAAYKEFEADPAAEFHLPPG